MASLKGAGGGECAECPPPWSALTQRLQLSEESRNLPIIEFWPAVPVRPGTYRIITGCLTAIVSDVQAAHAPLRLNLIGPVFT